MANTNAAELTPLDAGAQWLRQRQQAVKRKAAELPGTKMGPGWYEWVQTCPWPQGIALDLPELKGCLTRSMLVFDTETTGLSGGVGTCAFMIGCLELGVETLHLRQFYLTQPCGERDMLLAFKRMLVDDVTLVSYNGKSFDWPLLQARARLHRIRDFPSQWPHVDLLHAARRHWSGLLPDFRLQTVARAQLGLTRVNDLDGAFAPEAWRRFLRTGDCSGLIQVLAHNRRDLVSLAAVWTELLAYRRHESFTMCDDRAPICQALP